MRSYYAVVVATLALFGCGKDQGSEIVKRPGEPPVIGVEEGDAEMAQAEARARAGLDGFIAKLKSAKPGSSFFVKVALPTPDASAEHIWLEQVRYADGVFVGLIGNEPLNLPNYKLGSEVKVKREEVEDWIVMTGDQMEGGFTAKVLEKRQQNKQ